ncbi:3-oxoacyl-ACP synthase KasB [Mycobacterium intracellulare]|uniref:3-oxoacyl-[acyl-carrier-protein] synthase 2 n=9 Tax=Mycobacterium TaxID=1763 RepID=A0A7R7MX78_MYCIT|nr:MULTISPECIES: 3-oxoacyl-ACP synthase KasB [Mycobacterium]AFC45420.1 3-oxoacyl-(acyl carrier protein) synthase II [Mycobacterium intracellulare ATCC 13950]AFC50572.1 3-oxoacyl-(acyl carrier protein) synthase II [Mycobacterium intracellulare MOTT-02]AFC55848.1 3-oxoacyl-(acyl carrier protein) synthase II [Mycobacterium paraintracellulare]ETZ31820.1 3-oxoacyl-[acyl-carrier-protein] synthase 2 [Mycobacterium intracellulare MIN_061107_1834]MCA2251091.1 beta-ketoacyl-ACP synthase [Mycobacterium i
MAELVTGKTLPNVVVTGIAMTTALATDAESTWKLLLDRQSGIRKLEDSFVEEFDLPVRIGGHLLEDFDGGLTRAERHRMGYLQMMSTVLGRRVWENAGSPEVDSNRLMVSVGTGLGSAEQIVFSYDDLRARGMKGVSPLAVSKYMPNGAAAAVGLERHAKAGVITPVSACASGSEGVAQAWRNIVFGEADIAICGGVEVRIEAVAIAAFAQMRIVMSTKNDDPVGACRPFDRDRTGFVFGEAGALMVIETEEHAKARGANILARIMGASITSDGYHMVAPDPNGERAGHAMSRAIQLAGLSPSDIHHVNAHATGTSVGDVAEGRAINNALGPHGGNAAVYAPKAALGHSVGAVGAVESILTVLALRDQVVPPTLNLENLDPEIDLDVVAGKPRPGNYEYAINNSFGFGGHNVATVFGRY